MILKLFFSLYNLFFKDKTKSDQENKSLREKLFQNSDSSDDYFLGDI